MKNFFSKDNRKAKNIKLKFVVLFILIIIIAFSKEFVSAYYFYELNASSPESSIINYSGKQRMLSQRISKDTYALYISENSNTTNFYLNELKSSLQELEGLNSDLKSGNLSNGTTIKNSSEIMSLFSQIQEPYNKLTTASNDIISIIKKGNYSKELIYEKISIVQSAESDYLEIADKIVSQYVYEYTTFHNHIYNLSLILFFLIITLIICEIIFVIVPAKGIFKTIIKRALANHNLILDTEKISRIILKSQDLNKTLQSVLEVLRSTTGCKAGFIFLNDGNSNKDDFSVNLIASDCAPELQFDYKSADLDPFKYSDNYLADLYEKLKSGDFQFIKSEDITNKKLSATINSIGANTVGLFPIIYESNYLGFVLLACITNNNNYSESELNVVRTISFFMAVAIQKEKYHTDLQCEIKKALEYSESKTNFLSNISHEIRNHLNSILGITSILSEVDLTPETQNYVRILQGSGNNLLKIVNNVLDISKIESGKMYLREFTFNFRTIVKEVTYLFREYAAQKNVNVIYEIDDALPESFTGYGDGLQQIIVNLVGNALKFTNEGYIKIVVKVINIKNDIVSITASVIDTGIGIDHENLDKIFNIYTQADSNIKKVYQGTGLGLAISKNLIKYMGGNIGVESELGKGSKFYFNLDLKISSENAVEATSENKLQAPETEPENSSPLNLLVVDDSEDNLFLMEVYLKKYNCLLTTAINGEDAVKKFKNNNFDLVLMDIQMPIKSGYEAISEIRSYEREMGYKSRPIIALTSYAFKDEVDKILNSGFTSHLSKPIKKKILIETLNHYKTEKIY